MNPGLGLVLPAPVGLPPLTWPSSPSDTDTTASDCYDRIEPFFDIHRRSNIKEDHNDLCERALTQANVFPQLPSSDGLPPFPISDMHDRATGALDGTFLFLVRFEEHKDTSEVVGLLKQYLAKHKWAFKQNTAFKKLSNKKIERATFQVLGPLSRRDEPKDEHRLSIYITKHSEFGNKWLFEFRRSSRNVNSIPTEILPERVAATFRDSATLLPSFPTTIICGPAKYDYMDFARRSIDSYGHDDQVARMASSISDFWGTPSLSTLEIVAPNVGTAKRAEAAINSFLLLGGHTTCPDEPPKKYRKLDSQFRCSALTCGIWWDLASGRVNVSTFDGFVQAALEEANVNTADLNMQMSISTLCSILNRAKCPISLIVFTGAELLDTDLCALGRWKCIQRALNSMHCSTKLILITESPLTSYTDPQGVCRIDMEVSPSYFSEISHHWMSPLTSGHTDEVTSSDDTTSAAHAGDVSDVTMFENYSSDMAYGGTMYDAELGFNIGLHLNSESPQPLFVPDLQLDEVSHPSLNGIYESFMASRKRKYPF